MGIVKSSFGLEYEFFERIYAIEPICRVRMLLRQYLNQSDYKYVLLLFYTFMLSIYNQN